LQEGLLNRSAIELAELVRSGELKATELVQASLDAIEAHEPAINAFTHVAAERALATAAEIAPGDPRQFAGVPIAIKDNRAVAGMPLTIGSDLFGDFTPQHDAFLVRRLKAAGFVIVGKTALPENGILPTCESRRNGPTANPWALDRTPGGSSGGSAAAVAAGMVPIAHGNDGGGSIRIPAACCGLVGLKPSRDRISVGPESGHSFLVSDGVLTRTVAETAALLDILAGYEPGDAGIAPPPPEPYAQAATHPPQRLRIGVTTTPALESAALDPICEQATLDAAALLESLGHRVEPVAPPWSGEGLLEDFTRAFGPLIAMTTIAGGRLAGRAPTEDDVEPLTWEMYQRAMSQNVAAHLGAMNRLERLAREIVASLAPYDAVLTPALAQRPVPTGAIQGRGPDPMGNYRRSGAFTPYTAIINVTGQPAIALPLYQGADGLPAAVQLIGRPWREDVLLALAAELEAALPWAGRRPALTRGRELLGVSGAPPTKVAAQATPSTAAIRCGITPSDSASAVPWRETVGIVSSTASSQVVGAAGPSSSSPAFNARRAIASGIGSSGRLRCTERSASEIACRSVIVSGPASSNRPSVGWVGSNSAAITQSATSSAQIGWAGASLPAGTGTTGSSAIRRSSFRYGSPGE
jgi:amidase